MLLIKLDLYKKANKKHQTISVCLHFRSFVYLERSYFFLNISFAGCGVARRDQFYVVKQVLLQSIHFFVADYLNIYFKNV